MTIELSSYFMYCLRLILNIRQQDIILLFCATIRVFMEVCVCVCVHVFVSTHILCFQTSIEYDCYNSSRRKTFSHSSVLD